MNASIAALYLLLPAADARAGWSLGAGVETFTWTERTAPLAVRESGRLLAVRTGLSQSLGRGFLAAYHGRFYLGNVSYEGALLLAPSVPATGTTRYLGTTQHGQLRHGVGLGFDAVVAIDLDLWQRRLGPSQSEDYSIVSVRLGAGHAAPRASLRAEAGLECTLATYENAHFMELGFEQNPPLEPGRSITPYAEFGYAFARHWSLMGSLVAFDFGRSNQVVLTQGGTRSTSYQPESTMRVVGLWLEYQRD